MTTAEILKTVLYGMGIAISLPLAIALWRVAFVAGGIVKAVEQMGQAITSTNEALEKFADHVQRCLSDHTERIATMEGRWDGNERRQHERRSLSL